MVSVKTYGGNRLIEQYQKVQKKKKDFPLIKDIKQGWIYRRQDVKKMYEQHFPDTQLKFMEQINDQYVKKVEA